MTSLPDRLTRQLQAVAIPPALRGFASEAPADQAFAVSLDQGRVSRIAPAVGPPQGMLLSAFVDLHVHLDKNFTVASTGAVQGDLFAAIERIAIDRARWTPEDLTARMTRALTQAYAYGSRALRTHLDWMGGPPPPSLAVFQALRAAWADRLTLQWVSLTPLDCFAQGDGCAELAQTVREGGGILGAFVYRNDDLQRKLARVFDLAQQHDLDLDFHVDEGLHADAEGLRLIADMTVARGWQGRVTCGHACSLSVQDAERALGTLARCDQAGIHLVALPTTNLYLQGAWDQTPVQRGITRLNEAYNLGVSASIATDNVADVFYPYGSYDLLEALGLGVQVAHLAPAMAWLGSITCHPARAMGLAWEGLLAEGCPADLVVLDACNEYELLSPEGRRRSVLRAGALIAA